MQVLEARGAVLEQAVRVRRRAPAVRAAVTAGAAEPDGCSPERRGSRRLLGTTGAGLPRERRRGLRRAPRPVLAHGQSRRPRAAGAGGRRRPMGRRLLSALPRLSLAPYRGAAGRPARGRRAGSGSGRQRAWRELARRCRGRDSPAASPQRDGGRSGGARTGSGRRPTRSSASACHRATGGNPLFLRELVSRSARGGGGAGHRGGGGDEVGPPAVGRFVLRRLERWAPRPLHWPERWRCSAKSPTSVSWPWPPGSRRPRRRRRRISWSRPTCSYTRRT